MEEKNLPNEDIVKALECCIKEEHKDCPQCGEFVSQFDCMRNAISNALDIIRRLQADNIQLKWNYVDLKERYVKVLYLNEKVIAKQNAEIERLIANRNVQLIKEKNNLAKKIYEEFTVAFHRYDGGDKFTKKQVLSILEKIVEPYIGKEGDF